jgi:diguanylate cyclase (GGDEF)-like protein/PAS domain S-box-containing protein
MIRLPPSARRLLDFEGASLKFKLTLGAVVLGLTLLLVQSMVQFFVLRGDMIERIKVDQFALVSEVAAGLDEKIQERQEALSQAAKVVPVAAMGRHDELERFLTEERALLSMFDDLYIFDAKGLLLVDWPRKASRRGLDMSARDYIKGVQARLTAVVSQPVLGRSTGQPIVVIAAPILDAQGHLAGILGGVLNLYKPNLLGSLPQRKIGDTGYFYMVAPDRTVIAHPDRERILKPIAPQGANPLLDHAFDGFEGTGEGVNSRGLHGLFTFKRLQTNGWLLASVIPAAEAFQALGTVQRRMILTTLMLMLLCAPLLWSFARRQMRPLGELAAAVEQRTEAEGLEAKARPVPESGSREIRTVARAFNRFLAAWSQAEDRQRLASHVFETTAEAIVVCDVDANILAVNPAFCQITGYTEEEVQGRSMRFLRSDQHSPAFYKAMWRTVLDSGRWTGEIWNRRKNGKIFPKWQTISSVRNEQGEVTNYVFVFADLTEIRNAQQAAEHLSWNDPLTGMANRAQLLREMERHGGDSEGRNRFAALILVDLDRFKRINEARGLAVGDALLKIVAARISRTLAHDDLLARVDADEFAILLGNQGEPGAALANSVQSVAEKVRQRLREGIEVGGETFHLEASMGITLLLPNSHGIDAADILRQAETAIHQAKDAGGGHTVFYESAMAEAIREHYLMERELHRACRDGELRLFLQPQVDEERGYVGAEALVRWQHPLVGLTYPGRFIHLAEESDLIVTLDRWMLSEVCKLLARLEGMGLPLRISVNVSPRHFQRPDFLSHVQQTLAETGADPCLLVLEITEGLVIDSLDEAIAKMDTLTTLGIRFSMDDFGTGYSSLAYLKRLPVHELKIDRSFIQDAPSNPSDAALVQTIIAVAQHLELEIVAEGVETQAHADFLRDCGPVIHQGYLHGEPAAAEVWVERIRQAHQPKQEELALTD